MLVYSVIQVVKPGHNTSYPTGVNWVETRDHPIDAERLAETYNEACSGQCIGVRYVVTGPHDETIPFEDLKLEM